MGIANEVTDSSLQAMWKALQLAKQHAHVAGFGYEVCDAIQELVNFAEFEMDEKGVEYDGQ